MALNLRPPPIRDPDRAAKVWTDWFRDLQALLISAAGLIDWTAVSKVGSNLTDLVTRNHADLQNLNTASYTHLTSTQATDLTDAGDSTLHYHASDRARANHTGTQAASTLTETASRVLVTDGSGAVGTDADITFDGTRLTVSALTVDSPTLYVDATNNRVGIGTTSPADVLVVKQSTGEVRFGGGNGRTLSAYDSGVLANFDFTAVQTYFNSEFLIETGKTIRTANGSTGNLLLSTDDSSKVIASDRDFYVSNSAKGLILKDTASPAHYWRVTVNTSGTLVTTDLGTTAP